MFPRTVGHRTVLMLHASKQSRRRSPRRCQSCSVATVFSCRRSPPRKPGASQSNLVDEVFSEIAAIAALASCCGLVVASSYLASPRLDRFSSAEGAVSPGEDENENDDGGDTVEFTSWLRSLGVPVAADESFGVKKWRRRRDRDVGSSDAAPTALLRFDHSEGKGRSVSLVASSSRHDAELESLSRSDDASDMVVATVPRGAIIDVGTLLDTEEDEKGDEREIIGSTPAYFRTWLRASLSDPARRPFLTERRILILYYLCEGGRSPYLRTFPRRHPFGTKFLPRGGGAGRGGGGADKEGDGLSPPLPPLFWSENEINLLLRGTEILAPLRAKRRVLLREWTGGEASENGGAVERGGPARGGGPAMREWLQELERLAAMEADGANSDGDVEARGVEAADFEEFCWADSLFWTRVLKYDVEQQNAEAGENPGGSRAHHPAVTYHWVPLVDACNHSYDPTCYWSPDGEGNVRLIRTGPEGEKVENDRTSGTLDLCYDYGHKSNAELLFSHGFSVEDNPHDALTRSLFANGAAAPYPPPTEGQIRLLQVADLHPRLRLRRSRQPLDFGADALGHFDLESLYLLFVLVLAPEEVTIPVTGNDDEADADSAADPSRRTYAVQCCISETEEGGDGGDGESKTATTTKTMTIESLDDFEEFVDEHCDALVPRVLQLLEPILRDEEKSLRDGAASFGVPVTPPEDGGDAVERTRHRRGENERERFVRLMLEGQLRLVEEAQEALEQSRAEWFGK